MRSLRDESSRYLASTSTLQHNGQLFNGSISMNSIGMVHFPLSQKQYSLLKEDKVLTT